MIYAITSRVALALVFAASSLAVSSVAVADDGHNLRSANGRPLTSAMKRQLSLHTQSSGRVMSASQYSSGSQDNPDSSRSRVQQRLKDSRQSAINAARFAAADACY